MTSLKTMMAISKRLFLMLFLGLMVFRAFVPTVALADTSKPAVTINLNETDDPDAFVPAMKIVTILSILAVAPAILLMMTSFTRIVIVLSFVRQALGTQSMPPNQVLVGLALFLTLFTMSPVIDIIQQKAYKPYIEKAITQDEALTELAAPIRKFMLAETRETDLAMFYNLAKLPKPDTADNVSLRVLMPAFLVSELKTAFTIGFVIYLPFLVIDMVVSSVLMAMGMMMLPPTIVSLPFKLILFVLVDGWTLIADSLVKSFNVF